MALTKPDLTAINSLLRTELDSRFRDFGREVTDRFATLEKNFGETLEKKLGESEKRLMDFTAKAANGVVEAVDKVILEKEVGALKREHAQFRQLLVKKGVLTDAELVGIAAAA